MKYGNATCGISTELFNAKCMCNFTIYILKIECTMYNNWIIQKGDIWHCYMQGLTELDSSQN